MLSDEILLLAAFTASLFAQPQSAPHRAPPADVQRGDRVTVEVFCGGVLLKFEAEAQSSAHIGESVILLNPENGRRFIARVKEKGKVTIKK